MASYKDLIVWEKTLQLVKEVYRLTADLPRSEMLGLTSQLRRASISIPSNISEGYGRRSDKERRQFLTQAIGSAREVETQLMLVGELQLLPKFRLTNAEILVGEVLRMLTGLSRSLIEAKTKP